MTVTGKIRRTELRKLDAPARANWHHSTIAA